MELTVQEARLRVEGVRASAGDDEIAHGAEDTLYHDFVRAIAGASPETNSAVKLRRMARVILETEQIEFTRYKA